MKQINSGTSDDRCWELSESSAGALYLTLLWGEERGGFSVSAETVLVVPSGTTAEQATQSGVAFLWSGSDDPIASVKEAKRLLASLGRPAAGQVMPLPAASARA